MKFWEGPSGSGKSTQLYKYIISESIDHPDNTYLVIVPEQYTLKTQQDIVRLHPRRGILNVDVLSFNRLAHRIFEETGYGADGGQIIDDMGKNLILRRVAQINKDKLTILKDSINRLGYITQIKSTISEFMQYGITVEKAAELEKTARDAKRGRLSAKLSDVNVLYKGFNDYINGRLSTREELLLRLCGVLDESAKIRKCVVCFDGFTGFTPLQLNVIEKLLELSKEVHIVLTVDNRSGIRDEKEHELFYLSRHTISQVSRLADKCLVKQDASIDIRDDLPVRFSKTGRGMLSFLEANIFRNTDNHYDCGSVSKDEIHIVNAINPNEELENCAQRIVNLVRQKGYRYSDIAIVTGDIENYRGSLERVLDLHRLPYFIDKTQPVLMNPAIELVRAMVKVLSDNYTYESVFRFLRTGMAGIAAEDIDVLENYCLAFGVKGRSAWNKQFAGIPKIYVSEESDVKAGYLANVNSLREKAAAFFGGIESELGGGMNYNAGVKAKASTYSEVFAKALYSLEVDKKMAKCAQDFEESGNAYLASCYRAIFERILFVFNQTADILGDDRITIKEFGQLLDAGFDEIRIGVVPKNTDYIQVGDITRSRFNDIKAMFIVGVNDGIIPSVATSGGLLTDADKVFLSEMSEKTVLAPTARESAYSQRLYLYMLLTKPSEYLSLSYSKMSLSGESIRPSYLIRTVRNMFGIAEESFSRGNGIDTTRLADADGGYRYLTSLLGKELRGELTQKDDNELLGALISYFCSREEYRDRIGHIIDENLRDLKERAGGEDTGKISKAVAAALFGKNMYASVTKLEKYAQCAYEYYLQYGLKLQEREMYDFAASDLGLAFHGSLERYFNKLRSAGISFTQIEEGKSKELMDESVEEAVAMSELSAMYATKRTAYMLRRIKRIMEKTVSVLKYQTSKGMFAPHSVEVDFGKIMNLEDLTLSLSDGATMRLLGKIDRVDTYREGDVTYVAVIDYKSSDTKLDLDAVNEGKQLQLIVYLDTAMKIIEKESGTKAIPAGVFYYHIDDPIVEADAGVVAEEIDKRIRKSLRLKGYANADKHIIELMDGGIDGSSDVIPVGFTKDMEFNKRESKILTTEEFIEITGTVRDKIIAMGDSILGGDITSAREKDDEKTAEEACRYCVYKTVCHQKGISKKSYKQEDGGDE